MEKSTETIFVGFTHAVNKTVVIQKFTEKKDSASGQTLTAHQQAEAFLKTNIKRAVILEGAKTPEEALDMYRSHK